MMIPVDCTGRIIGEKEIKINKSAVLIISRLLLFSLIVIIIIM